MRSYIDLINEAQSHNTITVYRGTEADPSQLHRNMFFSSDPDFAANYGEVHSYQLVYDASQAFDSLDSDMVAPLLPMNDPYDDEEIATMDDYMERSSDTWEMLEDRWGIGNGGTTGYPIAIVYEGGTRNYLVTNPEGCVTFIQ